MNGQIKLLYLQAYESIIARNLLDQQQNKCFARL